ncbi:PH domain-containing protein [Pseudonocardia sp. C8]|uniref:PH domain-containing protein n=1 Tax=Pseudonocardia sp. C8 TaxID=2762759 RepID=UPI0016425B15|nr:PH domain-containing protein [Pseudonocardia sp. C8]MBC3192547.1 PH domain-containing protein [Pseudonocardia sp. C8]
MSEQEGHTVTERTPRETPPTGPGPDAVTLRPRALLITAWVCAVAIMILFAVVAYLMPAENTGVIFRPADQVAMMVIGAFVAGGLLLMARPRARADRAGIEVRNVLTTRWFPWTEVLGVSFPDGASSARLELPDDEYHPVLAVQAVDRGLAVRHVRTLRDLHRAAVTGR